jgi:hypothetical protein
MHRKPSYGEIAQTDRGQGEITFPRGGRIQSRVTLTHYTSGRTLLTCEGRFTPESYPAWERLVHQYRLDGRMTFATARQTGQVEHFAGRLEDDRPLTIGQMVLISAQAQGLAFAHQNLLLQMVFDCQEAHLGA